MLLCYTIHRTCLLTKKRQLIVIIHSTSLVNITTLFKFYPIIYYNFHIKINLIYYLFLITITTTNQTMNAVNLKFKNYIFFTSAIFAVPFFVFVHGCLWIS